MATPLETPDVKGADKLPNVADGVTVDTLLKHVKEDDKYVYYQGGLKVDKALAPDFEKAQQYLAKSPEGLAALQALENAKGGVTVVGATDKNDYYDPRPTPHEIHWDPKSAILNADGSSISPAIGLLHEQGHAIEYANHPDRYVAQTGTANKRYDNAEEQRNIQGLEKRVATDLGEGLRQDHGGIPYRSLGPTSRAAEPHTPLTANEIQPMLANQLAIQKMHGYDVSSTPTPAAADIKPFDGKTPHTGTIVHVDGNTVVQSIGRGQYVSYDVQRDLHGKLPPENTPGVSISKDGYSSHVTYDVNELPKAPPEHQAPAHVGR